MTLVQKALGFSCVGVSVATFALATVATVFRRHRIPALDPTPKHCPSDT